MRNPIREKLSVSDYSEDSDASADSELESDTKEEDHSAGSDSGSESNLGKQDNSKDSESEDESESESDSESEDDSEDKDEEFDHKWEELRNEAPDTDEVTRRIAVCNMDWDRIRAVDLLVCFNSFKPADGIINSVKIYPSEFGLKRMEEEKLKGPPELVEKTLPLDQEEVDDKKSSKYHQEKLRQYQINRLKYYYAVVDCDSPETANAIYDQLNGMEYESSSVRFDLRFIPDDMTFDHKPTCVAEKVPTDYKPRLFVTSALQQVKVDLTWDETDIKRREFFQKLFTDPDSVQDEYDEYIASSESESEDEADTVNKEEKEDGKNMKVNERISVYKELLKSFEEKDRKEKEEKIDAEITWEPALEKKTKEKVKEKMKKNSLNPFEEMLSKKKEQRKLKKKGLKAQTQSGDSEEDSEEETSEILSDEKSKKDKKLAELALISDYNNEAELASTSSFTRKKKKKDKSDDLDGFVADMNDPRFSAMHTSSLFNMVPTEHQNKKKNDDNFSLKRSKEKRFKSHGFQKHNKKARYH